MWLQIFHAIGLTNLSDEQVTQYVVRSLNATEHERRRRQSASQAQAWKRPPTDYPAMPPLFLPTPTLEYHEHRARKMLLLKPYVPSLPTSARIPPLVPDPPPLGGARALIWKQGPSVAEIGLRKVYLPGMLLPGPRDARITVQGLPPISPNAMGDFIERPGTDAFDAVHTFATVRETSTMCQRVLGSVLPWQWNSGGNTDPLNVLPHGLPDAMQALYSRAERALKFGHFVRLQSSPPQRVFTCRSLDIVAHQTGHAILDGLKPQWISLANPPQTGGLEESFGDLLGIFLTFSQMDWVESVIAHTCANLHDKAFLVDLADEFGSALGRPNGLLNADNNITLSQVGTDVHALSQVFTGAIYDILADIFALERYPAQTDDAALLYAVGQYVCSLVLRAIIQAPAAAATFADVANKMLQIAAADGKPVQYRNFIRNRFTVREVVVSPTPLTVDLGEAIELAPGVQDAPGAVQNRSRCCGTMQHPEYTGGYEAVERELADLRKLFV